MSRAADSPAEPTFEEALTELERIVRALDEGAAGLADSLAQYERGVKLLKQCQAILERAERKIELLTGIDAQGRPITAPFDDEATAAAPAAETRSRKRSKPARPAIASDDLPVVDDPPTLF